jgi:hypothetical protein
MGLPRQVNETIKLSLLLALLVIVNLGLKPPPRALADATYKKSRWSTKLKKGVLWAQGAGRGSWGDRWSRIAEKVQSYQEAGTAKGPMLIYKLKGKKEWHTVQLHGASGERHGERTFSKPVVLVRAGDRGVLIKVGKKSCYDLTWSSLRPILCDTSRYR